MRGYSFCPPQTTNKGGGRGWEGERDKLGKEKEKKKRRKKRKARKMWGKEEKEEEADVSKSRLLGSLVQRANQ